MQLIQKLKVYFKDTIKQGKIVRLTRKNTSWTRPLNQFVSNLNCNEWKEFEEQEKAFRRSLSCQGTFYDQFICKGDFTKWRKLIKLINGVFTKGGEFQQQKANGAPWDPNLCRYCVRILNSMPHEPSQDALSDGISIIAQLEKQLGYVTKTIQPFFSTRQGKVSQDPVSRNKLTNLWLHKRKKAIRIIRNDNKWPTKVNVEINQVETETYYRNEKNFILENESEENRATEQQRIVERCMDKVPLFTGEGIQNILRKLPNGKSPGLDGVRYEDVKREYDKRSRHCQLF